MKGFWRNFLDWVLNEPFRAMNRWSSHNLTRNNLFKDVRKLKNVEVSGDTIAWIERG